MWLTPDELRTSEAEPTEDIAHRRQALERALREALASRRELEAALRQRDAECVHLLEAAQAARAEAARANQVREDFLALLSHELRTPLNAMLGWLRIVNGREPDGPTTRRALEVIERNARVQLHLIEDLLDVSRLATGRLPLRTEAVELARVLTDAAESVRPAVAAKAIELTLRVEAPAVRVTGDGERLRQVVWNLLSNAIKFTPRHGRIALSLEQAMTEALIVVRDSGEGLAADFLPEVFAPFRQADTGTTRKHGGLGLGLTVVRHLVETHGGTVSAASAGPGQGSTFIIRLPLREAPAAHSTAASASA